jgi:uncharacterized membrane protein YeaQ/YmgE (transglycosylase-associated protein family)
MSVLAPVVLSVMAGWLATLTLQSDVSLIDFVIAIAGAAVAAAVAAPPLGISILGAYGVTMSGLGLMYAGAVVMLSAGNLFRFGHILRGRPPIRKSLRSRQTARVRASHSHEHVHGGH